MVHTFTFQAGFTRPGPCSCLSIHTPPTPPLLLEDARHGHIQKKVPGAFPRPNPRRGVSQRRAPQTLTCKLHLHLYVLSLVMVLASQGWCSSPTHHPLSPNADQGNCGTYLRLLPLPISQEACSHSALFYWVGSFEMPMVH